MCGFAGGKTRQGEVVRTHPEADWGVAVGVERGDV